MNKWYKYFLLVGSFLALFYLAFMIAYFPTSEPDFCSLCHQVKPYVRAWKESPHKNVKCLYCHEFRGALGKLHSKSRGVNYVYQYFTGQYTVFAQAQIFEGNCIACHLGDYYNYRKTVKLDEKHYSLIKENKSCLECHRETGHKTNLFSKDKFKK